MQFMLDEEKLLFLTLWYPSGLTSWYTVDTVIEVCAKQAAECLAPFLGLV